MTSIAPAIAPTRRVRQPEDSSRQAPRLLRSRRGAPLVALLVLVRVAVAADGNFTCTDPAFVAAAEQARVDSARFWTARELPGRWSRPCPIMVEPADHSGGGSTSFLFDRGEVSGWTMTIAGRRDTLLADVIPHEVDHMVRASLVRRPIPRWLDEGCATLMESAAGHHRHRERLRLHLAVPLDAAFLDAIGYPANSRDVDHLYTVGFSLVEFLLTRRDAATLLAFQLDARPPSRKLTDFYQLDVANLDREWRRWATHRSGRPLECQHVACPRHGSLPAAAVANPVGASRAAASASTLKIYTSRWCGPCLKFWSDLRSRAAFRSAIEQRYTLTVVDVDQRPDLARSQRIEAVPAFVTGSGRIYGYEGTDWLLSRLGLASASVPEPDAAPTPATAPTAPDAPAPSPTNESGLLARGLSWLLKTAVVLHPWGEAAAWLGGTAATGGAGALLAGVAVALWRRRRARRRTTSSNTPASSAPAAGGAAERPAPFPRALDEARELLQLRQSEGRVAVLDALRGMVLDDELHKAAANAGPTETAALNRLRAAVDARVNEIAPLSVQLEE